MADEKTRYWLKLDKDFLKSPHIKVIKNMPNGKDYVLFYLALMLESIESVGHLKFTDLIPYNDDMLSSLTDTNIDIVRSAVKIFESLGLMQLLDDGTIFMTQVAEMTGKRSESADRVSAFRERQKLKALHVTKCNDNIQSTEYREESTENREERAARSGKAKRFAPPTLEELSSYCSERNNGIDPQYFIDYYEARGWMAGKTKMKDWKATVRTWERKDRNSAPKKKEYAEGYYL